MARKRTLFLAGLYAVLKPLGLKQWNVGAIGLRRWDRKLWVLLATVVAGLAIALPGFAQLPIGPGTAEPVLQSNPAGLSSMPIAKDALTPAEAGLQRAQQLYQAGRFAEAAQVLERERSASQSLNTQPATASLHPALVLSNLALTYQQLGRWQEAEAAIAASLQLLERPTTNPQLQVRAQALIVQSQLGLSLGKAHLALTAGQQAEADYIQLKDDRGQIHSRIRQAEALQALGFYGQALKLLNQVAPALQAQLSGPERGEWLRALGEALQVAGELDQAATVLQESLLLAATPADRSAVWLSLGNTARLQGRSQEADTNYQQAIAVAPTSLARVQIQLNQLSLWIRDRPTAAAALAAEIYPQLQALPPSRTAVYAQINLVESLIKLGEAGASAPGAIGLTVGTPAALLPTVAQYLQTYGIAQAQQLGDHRTTASALGTLGHLYEQQGRWAEAQAVTQQALALVPALPDLDIAYRLQWQLGRLLNHADNPQHHQKSAIAAYDAAVLSLQSLRSDLVATNQDVQFTFRDGVEPIYRESVQLLLQPETGSPDLAALEKARQRIEALQLAELDNFFRAACIEGKVIPLDTVVKDNPNAAIFYPILLSDAIADQVHVIVKIPGQPLYHHVTRLPKGAVAQKLLDLRRNLVNASGLSQAQQISQEVYQWLIPEPIAQQLAAKPLAASIKSAKAADKLGPARQEAPRPAIDTLVFVLDGALRNIPIAALYNDQHYLIEDYAVALNVGLQLFDPKPLQRQQLNVLAAGLVSPPAGFEPLPEVETEIRAISRSVGAQQIHPLWNEKFTSQALKQQVTNNPFNVVHLATHGQFSSKLKETFILTHDGRMNVTEFDQLLRNRNATRSEAVELLVLSACETAAGDNRATLGLAGLALRAGARTTLASLWRVDDRSTSDLMGTFYQELAKPHVTKAEALRRAQLALLKGPNPDYQEPSHWASFVLVGNWL